MASGRADTPGGDAPDGKKWLTVLVPAVGVALLVGVVVAMSALSDPDKPGDKSGKGGAAAARARRPMPTDLTKLSDGTAPTADDPDLKDLGNGLQYRDLKEGNGEECPAGATPIMDYIGWLKDGGKRFDTSFKPGGAPLDYPLGRLVKGWQQGVPGMKVGGIRKLVIPPELGYGAGGYPPDIPPNATLVFEIELLGIK